ncbi:MAG TPA: hypothetical protein VHW02_07035 [Rhizomicrobium sp.]|jgi:hypothetical protein|nr:hypothetical protein [Rhizomicrobium sp.]
MNRIPVGSTIGAAYRFALGHFLAILGVMWLPYLLLYGFVFGVPLAMHTNALDLMLSQLNDPDLAARLYMLGLRFLPYLVGAIISVGVLRRALGLASGPSLVYFSLGKPVWRLVAAQFIAMILFGIAAFVIILCCALVVGLVALVALADQSIMGLVVGIGAAVAVVVALGAMIYFAIRLLFLLGPVVVEQQRIGLEQAWRLSKDHAGSLFLVALGALLPVMILEMAIGGALLFPKLPALISLMHTLPVPPHGDDISQQQVVELVRQFFGDIAKVYGGYLYGTILFTFVFGVIFTGLRAGASAFAYRALVPLPEAPVIATEPAA